MLPQHPNCPLQVPTQKHLYVTFQHAFSDVDCLPFSSAECSMISSDYTCQHACQPCRISVHPFVITDTVCFDRKNGKLLGTAFRNVPPLRFYPSVGMHRYLLLCKPSHAHVDGLHVLCAVLICGMLWAVFLCYVCILYAVFACCMLYAALTRGMLHLHAVRWLQG